ncbi:NrdH-redoxin [Candidatus Nomurabacteria bacterium]|jgi:glutaredoxin 3|nr:NrdH-redoxin [Candidatus Saccharibacteria bacterium]MCA9312699.1 NrdH-redoxin [Candidatus Saccharibacteria bacterium]MCB9822450.1 NrdH-redoxin [Candidatus Nomurabacteria bacterium]
MSKATNVIVYSTSWCGYCHQAMAYFDSIGVKYKQIDVEEDRAAAEEMVKKSHQMGVPVIEIGKEVIVGYNRPKIDAALKASDLLEK